MQNQDQSFATIATMNEIFKISFIQYEMDDSDSISSFEKRREAEAAIVIQKMWRRRPKKTILQPQYREIFVNKTNKIVNYYQNY